MTKTIENIEGKGLEPYNTAEVDPEIFYKSDAAIRSAITIKDGILYFGNEAKAFIAVDIKTQTMIWKYLTDDAMEASPCFENGKIIFNAGNTIYILDAANGTELQKITRASEYPLRLSIEPYAFHDSHVAVADGVVYFANLDGELAAIEMESEKLFWTLPPENQGPVASGISCWDQKLYFTDRLSENMGFLRCVDMKTGCLLFTTQLNDRIFAPMYIDNGKIYLGGRSCKFYCIDALSGQVLWSSHSRDATSWFSGGSVAVGDALFTGVSDDKILISFDKNTGEFLRLYPTGANCYTQPLVSGSDVIVAATDVYTLKQSYIMAFDTINHTMRWQAALSDGVLSSPAVNKGVLYFGTESGIVYSIKL